MSEAPAGATSDAGRGDFDALLVVTPLAFALTSCHCPPSASTSQATSVGEHLRPIPARERRQQGTVIAEPEHPPAGRVHFGRSAGGGWYLRHECVGAPAQLIPTSRVRQIPHGHRDGQDTATSRVSQLRGHQ